MVTVFTSLACSPGRTSWAGEDCRPRTTWRPLTLAGSPALPPLRLTGGFCHADWTVPRQDVNSPFLPCVCHLRLKGVCTHAGSGPSRVRRRLFLTCLGDPIPLAIRFVTDQFHDRSEKPDKSSDKKLGQKSSKRRSSDARQLGCVFQDMTPPKSVLWKCTDMPKPIQRVKFTKAIARHTKIRDQNPSLGYFCPGERDERSPNAPKFEDRSQEETEWQEQGALEGVRKLAKSVLKFKEHERATFFSPSENRCLPASTLKPEER